MSLEKNLKQNFYKLVDIARWAPTVHNTLPFHVRHERNKIHVSLNPMYLLKDGDPTGRESIISLGIFVEALCVAARAYQMEYSLIDFEGDRAVITLTMPVLDQSDQRGVELLYRRFSDRSMYYPAEITKEIMDTITNSASDDSITIKVVREKDILSTIATLTAKGIRLALSSPGFRKELSRHLIMPWSIKKRGISVNSLYIPRHIAWLEPLLLRLGIGLNAEARLEKKRWLSASAAVIILGDGDMPDYWFEAGRSYLRASLAIESRGLSQATSAAIVEASTFHEDIEALLKTDKRILCMLRIGHGSTKRYHSPRVTASELIVT